MRQKPDPDPPQRQKVHTDTHQSQNSGAVEVHIRAFDAHTGGVEARNGTIEGLQTSNRRFASLR